MDPPMLLGVLRGHEDAVNGVCFLHHSTLSSVSGDGILKLWNLSTKRCISSLQAHALSVQSVDYLPNSRIIVTSGRDGHIKLWDSEAKVSILSYPGCNHFCGACCDRNQWDDNMIAVASECTFKAVVWDRRAPPHEPAVSFPCNAHGMVMSVLLSSSFQVPDTTVEFSSSLKLLVGCEDGTVSVFDCRKGSAVGELKPHTQPVFALDVTPSNRIATGAADIDIILTEPPQSGLNDQLVSRFVLPEVGTSCVRVSGNGKLVVSTHWDSSVRLFNKKMKPLGILGQHRAAVNTVRFRDIAVCSNDVERSGTVFATGSKDCTVALWAV